MNQQHKSLLQQMREKAHALLQKADHAEINSLNRLVDVTREELAHLGHYTEAELEQAAAELKAELKHKASEWAEEWQEIRQWAEFDLELVEDRVLEKLLSIADPTRVEMERLLHQQPPKHQD